MITNTMTSFIIVNYNTWELTCKCVATILEYIPEGSYEIIVVDNGSKDDDKLSLKKNLSENCRLVESRLNVGFGAGNMLGANLAKGRFLCFINSDVELMEDCITPLCQFLDAHDDVGCVTPQQYDREGRHARSFRHKTGIRHDLLGDSIFERLFPRRFPNPDMVFKGGELEVSQLNGSFMMFPADKFWAIGGFDTNIFLYYEEYDIGIRLSKRGWKSVVLTKYRFRHCHGATINKYKSITKRELYISKLYTYSKHHNWLLSTIYRVINLLTLSVKPSKWYILKAIIHSNTLSRSMRHLR